MTDLEWPFKVQIRYQLDILHTPIVLSTDAEAKNSPSGEKITLQTQFECSERDLMSYPVETLHMPIVRSTDPDAKYSPFGEKTTQLILEE